MSDNWLQFIPTDPAWLPSREAADDAASLLREFAPRADEVDAEFKEQIEFFHPGGNWDGVQCSACSADLEDWWSDVMDTSAANGFTDLTVETPCCGTRVSLNDLRYGSPAGFARFALEVMNPDIPDLSAEQEHALSARLGHSLRKIWLHI